MHSHSPEQEAIAARLAADLRSYDAKLGELLLQRWDPELYRELSDQFDRMQLQAESLPRLSASWTELLVSRVELTHALWTLSVPARVNGKVVAHHAQHRVLIGEVVRTCEGYVANPAAPGHDGEPGKEPQRP